MEKKKYLVMSKLPFPNFIYAITIARHARIGVNGNWDGFPPLTKLQNKTTISP
jgi:hypothetical protein